ncbi:hypothetical protein ACLB2K_064909 [Fragaria x ananassa]
MALDADVVFPQDPFTYTTNKDLYNLLVGNWSYDGHENYHHHQQQLQEAAASFDFLGNQTDHHFTSYSTTPSMVTHFDDLQLSNSNSDAPTDFDQYSQFQLPSVEYTGQTTTARPKRRRARSKKNKEEIENQRMTHIAVERNRRKQMNEYLSALRSIMPDSYVQRGDQASIIGGAINFVKELENQVQFLGAQKPNRNCSDLPFSDFFSFPQYSSSTRASTSTAHQTSHENRYDSDQMPSVEHKYPVDMNVKAAEDIEVTMVESHANLKVRSKRVPKQLLKFVSGLHTLRLTVLHLNVSTFDEIVLYSLSVKVEEDCELTSVDEIATAVYQMLARIQEEAMLHLN